MMLHLESSGGEDSIPLTMVASKTPPWPAVGSCQTSSRCLIMCPKVAISNPHFMFQAWYLIFWRHSLNSCFFFFYQSSIRNKALDIINEGGVSLVSLEPHSLRGFLYNTLRRQHRTTLAGFVSSPDGNRLSLNPLGKVLVHVSLSRQQ